MNRRDWVDQTDETEAAVAAIKRLAARSAQPGASGGSRLQSGQRLAAPSPPPGAGPGMPRERRLADPAEARRLLQAGQRPALKDESPVMHHDDPRGRPAAHPGPGYAPEAPGRPRAPRASQPRPDAAPARRREPAIPQIHRGPAPAPETLPARGRRHRNADGPGAPEGLPVPRDLVPAPEAAPGRARRRGQRRGADEPVRLAGRPVRHRDEEPAPIMAAKALAGHLVITDDRVLAYYRVPLQRWSFRPESERVAMVISMAARLAQLTGRRCHLRITSRPFEVWQWAQALDTTVRGPFDPAGRPSRQVMPGPCQRHPDRSQHGCPTCVPGLAWLDWLGAEQHRMRQWAIADREVYLGVELTARGSLRRVLGDRWARAGEAERASLAAQAATVTAAVAAGGLNARPVTPAEMQWLFVRSCGIHLPAPLPVSENPAPFPYAQAAAAATYAGPDDLAAYAEDFPWATEPFNRTVEVSRADGATAHVAVLTVSDLPAWQDLAAESPWIQRTEKLPFPVEWSITFDVLNRKQVQGMMGRRIDKIRANHQHIVGDHAQEPPPVLERQMEIARRIQTEADNPESGATYVWAWFRLAVAGSTPDQAVERAGQLTELYAPGITIKQQPGQYKLLREFIPGEPLSNAANRRFVHLEFLAGGMPTASAQIGHREGFPLGVTSSLSCRTVTYNPFRSMEVLNASGLVTATGGLGGGKSSLAGLLAYLCVRAGIATAILDPSGMLDRLCDIPALRGHAMAANLLESEAGTLCPYRLIADPPRERFAYDEHGRRIADGAAEDRWQQALRAAEVQRRGLTADILRMLLPAATATDQDEKALREAVRRAPATQDASPRDVIAELAKLTDYGLADHAPLVARELEGTAEHPLARLFFPAAGGLGVSASGRLLTVMTLRGLVVPDDSRRPEERTTEEQLSIPVLHLAAQLLRRLLFDLPRGARKAAFLDEAHALTRDAVGRRLVNELARDSRKNNIFAMLISQNAPDLLAAGIANLIGAAFAFRTEGDEEQAATCGLLRIPRGRGYEARLSQLSSAALAGTGRTGECLFFDGYSTEQIQVDLGADPDLRAALNTTPGSGRRTWETAEGSRS